MILLCYANACLRPASGYSVQYVLLIEYSRCLCLRRRHVSSTAASHLGQKSNHHSNNNDEEGKGDTDNHGHVRELCGLRGRLHPLAEVVDQVFVPACEGGVRGVVLVGPEATVGQVQDFHYIKQFTATCT